MILFLIYLTTISAFTFCADEACARPHALTYLQEPLYFYSAINTSKTYSLLVTAHDLRCNQTRSIVNNTLKIKLIFDHYLPCLTLVHHVQMQLLVDGNRTLNSTILKVLNHVVQNKASNLLGLSIIYFTVGFFLLLLLLSESFDRRFVFMTNVLWILDCMYCATALGYSSLGAYFIDDSLFALVITRIAYVIKSLLWTTLIACVIRWHFDGINSYSYDTRFIRGFVYFQLYVIGIWRTSMVIAFEWGHLSKKSQIFDIELPVFSFIFHVFICVFFTAALIALIARFEGLSIRQAVKKQNLTGIVKVCALIAYMTIVDAIEKIITSERVAIYNDFLVYLGIFLPCSLFLVMVYGYFNGRDVSFKTFETHQFSENKTLFGKILNSTEALNYMADHCSFDNQKNAIYAWLDVVEFSSFVKYRNEQWVRNFNNLYVSKMSRRYIEFSKTILQEYEFRLHRGIDKDLYAEINTVLVRYIWDVYINLKSHTFDKGITSLPGFSLVTPINIKVQFL